MTASERTTPKPTRRWVELLIEWMPWVAACLGMSVVIFALDTLYERGDESLALLCAAGVLVLALILTVGATMFFVHELGDHPRGDGVGNYPVHQIFHDVGPHGEITVDCAIWPSASPLADYPPVDEQLDSGFVWVPPQRVGSFHVETDKYGLRFRWESAKTSDDPISSPFHFSPSVYSTPNPSPQPDGGLDDQDEEDGPRKRRPLNVEKK